jgi:large subunit ribosomal protein L1
MAKAKKPAADQPSFDKSKAYPIAEAVSLTKQLSKVKFDATVELHVRLGIDPKKGEQAVRGAVSLPHGTGKTIKVAAFVSDAKAKECKEAGADLVGGDELIAEIKKSEKTDFEVAVSEPGMMKNLAQIAKILGTRGLMPSPKNETVSPDPAKAVRELKKGKVSFKNDDTANLHLIVGKVSFSDENLAANLETAIDAIKKAKPATAKGTYLKSITVASTMGPGIKVAA